MRYKLVLFLTAILVLSKLYAQIDKPVSWRYVLNPGEYSVGDTIDVVLTAKIDDDWYMYSSDFDPTLGPLVTSFTFKPHHSFEVIGDVKPIGAKKKFEIQFNGEYTYFTRKAEFIQEIVVLSTPISITGSSSYQVCTGGKCVSLTENFLIGVIPSNIENAKIFSGSPESKQNGSLLNFFFLSILAGLAAILTPCVFPMIPMTVSFFMGKDKNKSKANLQASIFGISIVLIYTVLGTLVAATLGAGFANYLSTHWLPNIFFSLIFLIFAFSFFGMFEITLPHWIVNKSDKQADRGGISGAFFMAFTLVLVSFSCTGPIVGALLVESATGALLKPIIGMLGFSLAFALPFTVFALFPSLMNSLPKSGGWLNSIKVVLGFIELALALKFFSIADQTYHWGILDREIYLALWIVIFTLMGFYLLGKLRFVHDGDSRHVGVPRLMGAILTFSFVVYLIPGMFGAPLKALSGYLPPQSSMDFDIGAIVRNSSITNFNTSNQVVGDKPKYSDFLHLPHGLTGYFDYQEGLAAAKQLNKPLFIDFTGHGCVNCREMEANVWSDPRVLQTLQEHYIIVALYVDDKTTLPENQWYTSAYDGRLKKTIGAQNSDLQITKFSVNAQPYYVLLNSDEMLLTAPSFYDLNVDSFLAFLEKGRNSHVSHLNK
jgi:thiol:disulfide interchange protein